MIMEITYPLYLAISIAVTVWVARSLSRNGRVFLVDSFGGHEQLADSINHLLVVGFYLINIGYVTLALRYGEKPTDATGAIEYLSSKVGLVLVVLGAMHFFNMYAILKLRRKATQFYEERTTSDAPAASPVPAPAKVY
jgi:Na+/melibiose symporter-like transporter